MLNFNQSLNEWFPRSLLYRNGFAPPSVNESANEFRVFPFQERHLQCLWADSRLRPSNLKTTAGESVTVEHPGNWNLEAGPDFTNAVLLIGKEKRRISGDLEIHVHANGWKQHGHTGDPNFSNTRFHIVYFQGEEIDGLIQIPLKEMITATPGFSFEAIDTTAYPYAIPTGDYPLKNMDPDQKTVWLESAGEERLRQKAARFALAMESKEPEQILWEELMAALGYKNNKGAFRQIAHLLPLYRIQNLTSTPLEAYALLAGFSGLIPNKVNQIWANESRRFIRTVWDIWWKQPDGIKENTFNKSDWNLSGIRPANHPLRRLMAGAHLAFRIPDLIHEPVNLTQYPDNFWHTHLSWKSPCKPTSLIGKSRANAIITNVLIPYQAATGSKTIDLHALPPEPTNSIIRQTAYTLFGPDHSDKVYKSALARQGLIQIFHDYLITHRLDELKALPGGT